MRKLQQDASHDVIRLHVRRQEVFMDSYHQLKDREPEELCCKIRIQFVGEEGLDAGGLTREWYSLLARAMFNANSALFIPSANGVSFQPNSSSLTNKEHIELFKFVGRIIGKALFDGHPLDLYFTRSFYKHILGQEVNYQDMEDLDLDFYKSLKSLMDINLNESELHEYYFAYEEEEFGIHKIKELVPGGRTKRVTEENKIDYIKLLCHMKMTKNIQAQIDAFKSGFQELIPVELVSIFGSKELELLISGLPEVDLEDLRNNTDYHNYTHESQVIIWLWEVLYEFSHEERAEFIQFVTGSSKVPLEGFKALPGLGGTQKFQIHKSFTSDDRLPTAHTCMNQLDLPEYQTKEKLKNRLKIAISEGKEGFGFI
jgi:E3 ubiquitin-protein ligase HUWE1